MQEQFNPLADQQMIDEPMIEQEQIPMAQEADLSQLNLPDVIQQNEVQ